MHLDLDLFMREWWQRGKEVIGSAVGGGGKFWWEEDNSFSSFTLSNNFYSLLRLASIFIQIKKF